jgi:3-keto-disaccharide hydrolase
VLAAAQDRAGEWQSLFDGKSTAGWLEVTGRPFPSECWAVEDGCLKAFPGPHGNQDIRTVAEYTDFEFQFSWRILKGGNSGVKYLVQNTDRWTNAAGLQARARGPEYQLVDDESDDAKDPTRVSGALYSVLAPSARTVKAPGEWNESGLVVRGGSVEHRLNGALVLAYKLDQPEVVKMMREHRKGNDVVRTSPVCLQNHGSVVWFRGMRIRRLG